MSDNRPCPWCAAEPMVGDNPPRARRCAFSGDGGRFVPGNWACPSAERLKDFAETWIRNGIHEPKWAAVAWSDDETCATLGRGGTFLVLVWYKARNRLDVCALIRNGDVDPMPRLAEVLPFLENAEARYR